MKYKDLIKEYGSETKAAQELLVSVTCIRNWKINGIPLRAQHANAHISGGTLKVTNK